MSAWWQYIASFIQVIFSLSGLILLFQIARKIGAWEEWRKWAEEQLKSLGTMTHDLTGQVREIIGRLSK